MASVRDFINALQNENDKNSLAIIDHFLSEHAEAVSSYLHNSELGSIRMTALGYAVKAINVSAVAQLVVAGADVNQPISMDAIERITIESEVNSMANTALEEALAESQSHIYQDHPDVSKRKKCIEMIKLLLGADIDFSNQIEWVKTLAMAAPEAWPLVLAKGLSLHATNVHTGYNAITSIIMSKVAMGDILSSLIKMGVSANHIDREGDTPLLKLIKRKDFATDESWQMMLHELLTAPALDLRICDACGNNVFHYVGLLPEESVRAPIQVRLDAYILSREVEAQRKTSSSYFFGVPKDLTDIIGNMIIYSGMRP